jgi:putative IMPACT (imprinted ancient) family translation regulator
MDDDLTDELVAVTAIFPECVFRDGDGDAARTIKIYPLAYPTCKRVSLVLNIPPDYPNASPTLVASVGISTSDARNLLQSAWAPGEVCLFPFIESLRETLAVELLEDDKKDVAESIPPSAVISSDEDNEALQKYQFATSSAIVDRKSVFVGRAIEVHSRVEAESALRWLKEHDRKVSRATHNIVAWRFIEKGVLVKGFEISHSAV